MKAGRGKAKGSSFERKVCVAFSRWVTGGEAKDAFWRSAMSGGRATVHVKKGGKNRQSGDITAVAPEGHALTDVFFIECKHVRDLAITSFLFNKSGPLWKFWEQAKKQAADHGKEPMLIAKQNNVPTLVLLRTECGMHVPLAFRSSVRRNVTIGLLDKMLSQSFEHSMQRMENAR